MIISNTIKCQLVQPKGGTDNKDVFVTRFTPFFIYVLWGIYLRLKLIRQGNSHRTHKFIHALDQHGQWPPNLKKIKK